MTLSTDGAYYYYSASAGAHEFKLTDNTNWSGKEFTNYTPSKYNGTNLTLSTSNGNVKSSSNAQHYILLYLGNNGTTPVVCASTTLPTGLNTVWIKHNWGGSGSWTYKQATKNADGTFSLTDKYGATGCNLNAYNGENAQWWYDVKDISVEAGLAKGNEAVFTVDPVTRKISITKKVNKNLGDITITMNCNQQPNIYFWGVEGKTCAAWPGETMTAAGSNTYTYKFTNVDLDLGVNYKITLKKVNVNEWETGDLHTTTDITHTVADLNIPTIGMHGNFIDGWKDTEKFTISDDYTSATLILDGITEGDHEFGMQINGTWTANGKTFTRNTNSNVVKSGSGNLKLTADYTGKYTFTYTYKTQTLEVTYPELPTPEYQDITIQVYAKQVPNIWWWNGGDKCADADDAYDWDTAPAMEKVSGEDNWYTKTFANVDITKGGIKFKLKSQDQSIEGNELQTTEDKCYDARVINAVTETTCGELPSGEVPTVTYNVTVPAETPACYIAGSMNGWAFQEMTKIDDTHYTITIEGAEKTHKYKYTCGEGWDYVEKKADGSDVGDRTWTANDVVAKWGKPDTYTIAGTPATVFGKEWDATYTANDMKLQEDGTFVWSVIGLELTKTTNVAFKIVKNQNWETAWPAENKTIPVAEDGTYNLTIYFNAAEKDDATKNNGIYISFEKQAVVTPETYTRTVTAGHYGTICLPYASSSYSGAEFYEVSWLQKNGETPVNLYLNQLAAGTQLEAGKPYIFRATSTELTVTYTGAPVDAPIPADENNGLTGSFDAISAGGVLTGNYVVAQNKFWTATATAYADENRAYIDKEKVPDTEQKQIPGRRRVSLGAAGENAETGIDNIITTDTPVKVIENGQLIIIRNGEKFNVQGQKL